MFANVSFTSLAISESERLSPTLWRVDRTRSDLPYFPEAWLSEWLGKRGLAPPVYAIARTGVVPLAADFAALRALHDIDLVILVDGGTDSLIFGDEPGLGTVAEEAVSIAAAAAAFGEDAILAAIGFGIDDFHGVSHHSFLENVARMIREGAFLGRLDLVAGTPEAEVFCDLVDYAKSAPASGFWPSQTLGTPASGRAKPARRRWPLPGRKIRPAGAASPRRADPPVRPRGIGRFGDLRVCARRQRYFNAFSRSTPTCTPSELTLVLSLGHR